MKRFYECTFIVNPGMDDAQIEHCVSEAEDAIVKNGCKVVTVDKIGRRRLAYPIAKKNNGYYVSFEFEGEGRAIERIERHLKLDENIMRYLTISLNPKELEAKRARAALGVIEPAPVDEKGAPAAEGVAPGVAAVKTEEPAVAAEEAVVEVEKEKEEEPKAATTEAVE